MNVSTLEIYIGHSLGHHARVMVLGIDIIS